MCGLSGKWCRYPIVIAQWINRTSSVLRRMVRTPGGIVIHRTSRKPLLCGRERESVCVWDAVGKERRGERERVGRRGESRREREGESGREIHRARVGG